MISQLTLDMPKVAHQLHILPSDNTWCVDRVEVSPCGDVSPGSHSIKCCNSSLPVGPLNCLQPFSPFLLRGRERCHTMMALHLNSDPSVYQSGASVVRTRKDLCKWPCRVPNTQCLIKWELLLLLLLKSGLLPSRPLRLSPLARLWVTAWVSRLGRPQQQGLTHRRCKHSTGRLGSHLLR